ncbi:MAG: twin-arginine translocase TatA/TatE family subunit [Solirubrobacteraceae bacterium]
MGLDNPLHIAFIVVALLLVFGAKRLPEIGRSLGSGMREFKDSVSGNHSGNAQQQPTLNPVQQPQQAPTAPAQAPVPPVAAPPPPAQAAPAPAPAEPQPQHQA